MYCGIGIVETIDGLLNEQQINSKAHSLLDSKIFGNSYSYWGVTAEFIHRPIIFNQNLKTKNELKPIKTVLENYGPGNYITYKILLNKKPNILKIFKDGLQIHQCEIININKWYMAVNINLQYEMSYKLIWQ